MTKLKQVFNQLEEAVNPTLKNCEYIKLDFNSIYGGYRLDIVEPNNGHAERFFHLSSRVSNKEMIAFIEGYLLANLLK